MSEKVKSIVRAVPKLEVLTAMMDRQARLGGDSFMRADEVQEMKIALHLLESIEWTPVKELKKGVHCGGCNREIAAPNDGAIMALPTCWRCMALNNIVSWTEHNPNETSFMSLRFQHHHYGLASNAALDDPIMTVTLHNGTRVVTTGLRYQGPVPSHLRDILKDNCVVVQGNPEGLPLGVHS